MPNSKVFMLQVKPGLGLNPFSQVKLVILILPKGLFTWREGAPANRATRLKGLQHSPPLHGTHLTGTVSGLPELSLELPLSTTNITVDQENFFPSYFSFLHGHEPVLCLKLVYYIDLFRLTVILFGR